MTNINTIKEFISDKKIAKGCKKTFLANCATIIYPKHKREQYKQDIILLAGRFCFAENNMESFVQNYYGQGSGIIQIWLHNNG